MPITVITLGLPFLGPDVFGELYGPCWSQWLDVALFMILKYCLILMAFYDVFWQCDSKNQPLGLCNIYLIKCFNKCIHIFQCFPCFKLLKMLV